VPLRLILVAAVALVAGLGAAVAAIALVGGEESPLPGTSESVREEPVSSPPVTLSGTDVRTGEAIALRQLADKPVVIAVWASWCGACVRQADALERFVSSHAQVSVLAVDTQEETAAAQAFLESTGLELPTVADGWPRALACASCPRPWSSPRITAWHPCGRGRPGSPT
jgi:thiol-disulfide isomerase/thioredoxin